MFSIYGNGVSTWSHPFNLLVSTWYSNENCIAVTFLSRIFASMWVILRDRYHKFQCNQLKTRESLLTFLPWLGIEPRTFLSWACCLAITPFLQVNVFTTLCYQKHKSRQLVSSSSLKRSKQYCSMECSSIVSIAAFDLRDPGSNPDWFAVLISNQKLSPTNNTSM